MSLPMIGKLLGQLPTSLVCLRPLSRGPNNLIPTMIRLAARLLSVACFRGTSAQVDGVGMVR